MSGRDFHLMKAKMGRTPAVDAVVRLKELTDAVTYCYSSGKAACYVESGGVQDERNAIIVADIKDESDFLSLLLVRGDPNRDLPAYVNLKTKDLQILSTNDPEFVRASSCHLVFHKAEISSGADGGKYRMVMEKSHGISRTLAKFFCGRMMQTYAEDHSGKYVTNKRGGKKGAPKEQISYVPTVRFDPQANANVLAELASGKIEGFQLVHGKTKFTGEATESHIVQTNVGFNVRIVPTNSFDTVASVIASVKQEFSNITFKGFKLDLIDADGNQLSQTPIFKFGDDEQLDMRYCKKVHYNPIAGSVDECRLTFDDSMLNFAHQTILKNSHWE